MKALLATLLAALLGVAAVLAHAAPISAGPDLQSPLSADDDKDKDKEKDKKDG